MFNIYDLVEMSMENPYAPALGVAGRITHIDEKEQEVFIEWEDGFDVKGPFSFLEIKHTNKVEENYLENFRAAMREELSNWRDPKQVDGKHYTDLVIQPLDVAYLNGMNSARTKVLKYVMREKNGLKDLKKAYDMVAKCALYEYGVNLDEEYENDV